jgi:hypothetical protein
VSAPVGVLAAIRYEIAKARELGQSVECIRVSSTGIAGSVLIVPRLQGSFGTPTQNRASIASALRAAAGRPTRQVLMHPDDWELLLHELDRSPDALADWRLLGLPVEHDK